MRIKIPFIISLLIGLAFLNSCKKVDDSKVPAPGTRELVASKTWLLIGIHRVDGSHAESIDDTDCSNDLKWVFTNAGSFQQYENCDSDLDDEGRWTLDDKKITIVLDGNSTEVFMDILKVSSTTLEIQPDGEDVVYVFRPF